MQLNRRILLFWCILIFSSTLNAQTEETPFLRKSIGVGLGFGINKYITNWSFKQTDQLGHTERVYPSHKFIRQGITLNFEARSIWTYKRLNIDFGYDVFYGFIGATTEDWLTNTNEVISESGNAYGFGIFYKFSFPFLVSQDKFLTPFTGIFVEGAFMTSDGVGVSSKIIGSYNYEDGWNEGIIGATFPIGLEYDMRKMIIFTEYRIMIVGVAFTDWNPSGGNVKEEPKLKMSNFQIGIMYKL